MSASTNRGTVIVTGAAAGIGRAVSAELRRSGYSTVDIDLESNGLEIHVMSVQDERAWEELVTGVQNLVGLVNCAGIRRRAALVETSISDFREVIDTNVVGTFLGIRSVARTMMARGHGGSIVNVGSVVDSLGVPCQIAYNASKGAISSMTRSSGAELGREGIRVNAVLPGSVHTAMTTEGWDDEEHSSHMRSKIPLARPGTVAEIAQVARFLISDDASYVNASLWPVDGGWSSAAL